MKGPRGEFVILLLATFAFVLLAVFDTFLSTNPKDSIQNLWLVWGTKSTTRSRLTLVPEISSTQPEIELKAETNINYWWIATACISLVAGAAIIFIAARYISHWRTRRWGLSAVLSSTDVQSESEPVSGLGHKPSFTSSDDSSLGLKKGGLVWKKFMPLAIMSFAGLVNYTLLSNTKDVLVITAPRSGAEIIPFVKIYANLPGAVLWTVVLTKLSNRMAQIHVFYVVIVVYMTFFSLFAFVIYPWRHVLHPEGLADGLAAVLPPQFMAPIALFRYWTYSVFYVMAESWGSVMVATIMWGLANQICTVEEAKHYYPMLGFIGNVAPIFAGQYGHFVSVPHDGATSAPNWSDSLRWLTAGVVTSGITMLVAARYIQTHVLDDPDCVDATQQKRFKQRTKLSVVESTRLLVSSSYLRSLAILVVCYGLSMSMVDASWKSKVRAQYPTPTSYSAFMGSLSSTTGVVTLALMVLSRQLLCHCSWFVSAALTPLALGLTGITFFGLLLAPEMFGPLTLVIHTTPLMLAVLMGAAQNSVSKSAKWALFDPCKNMAFIPLEPEARTKGKAAIDVIGGPLGKSGGAFLQQILILALGSLSAAAPCLLVTLIFLTTGWLYAVHVVSRHFNAVQAEGGVISNEV